MSKIKKTNRGVLLEKEYWEIPAAEIQIDRRKNGEKNYINFIC